MRSSWGYHPVHKPDALGLCGVDDVAGHQQFLGLGHADKERPDDRAAVAGDESRTDMGVADAGAVGGVDHIAEECQRGAQACGHAVQGADDGLLHPQDVLDDAAPAGGDGADGPVLQGDCAAAFVHGPHIAAGAEAAPGAGEHHRADLRVAAHLVEGVFDLVVHHFVDRVQTLRAVQCDGEYLAGLLCDQRFVLVVGHFCTCGRVGGAARSRGEILEMCDII